jgi:hypothetical protein
VSAQSSSDAWAVGQYFTSSPGGKWATLILHWNGTAWSKVKSPSPSLQSSVLFSVSADAPVDAWAVGNYCSSQCANQSETDHTLTLHWNGTGWSRVN